MNIIGKVSKRIKSGAQCLIRNSVRAIAAFSWSRRVLNAVYLQLTPYQRSLFHQKFAKLFRSRFFEEEMEFGKFLSKRKVF